MISLDWLLGQWNRNKRNGSRRDRIIIHTCCSDLHIWQWPSHPGTSIVQNALPPRPLIISECKNSMQDVQNMIINIPPRYHHKKHYYGTNRFSSTDKLIAFFVEITDYVNLLKRVKSCLPSTKSRIYQNGSHPRIRVSVRLFIIGNPNAQIYGRISSPPDKHPNTFIRNEHRPNSEYYWSRYCLVI